MWKRVKRSTGIHYRHLQFVGASLHGDELDCHHCDLMMMDMFYLLTPVGVATISAQNIEHALAMAHHLLTERVISY